MGVVGLEMKATIPRKFPEVAVFAGPDGGRYF
jgi:hypothetical protein